MAVFPQHVRPLQAAARRRALPRQHSALPCWRAALRGPRARARATRQGPSRGEVPGWPGLG